MYILVSHKFEIIVLLSFLISARIYNLTMLQSVATPNSPIEPDESFEGYLEIPHSEELVDASFSSDGTAIATASADGFVKFFQASYKFMGINDILPT